MKKNGIKGWPEGERPVEKLFKKGEHNLSDAELLAVLLHTGVKGMSAVELGRKIIQEFRTIRQMGHTDILHWKRIKGIGSFKLARIRAAVEIGRRFMTEEKKIDGCVKSSREIADMMMPRMRDLKKEVFKILLLDGQNNVIGNEEIEEGTVNQAMPPIREIMQKAMQEYAAALVAVHNHPSGNPQPSEGDRDFTRNLVSAGEVMQVKVLDHIIIGDNRYYSFADEGLI
ncbi:hypothetical protein COY52_04525 [Candidatus Desantisbacteria bacterium CG_4_10_14_0_8_um_filter_48_22]|uniref:MPN domain-containing protein n=1 Tax=Candidatus Desantisbacteria bacterium CG_4_10_14_0_8_um_filter_48_22 TaxID=1974543 RepID=A0A2M7SD63_9BACT|nr:MAG: hypothetical protein AUJ67_04715 [Candidatus Desantisbacteria bacterium CG1_02_49_89]PIV57381.1 MAG: hypothetical protein COS16_00785 [Candidatus Desantisbacteria bacterium CG02_land_8_20_14_3_00_49_13]PIZ17465.1 MAG: hypothetical protein COY52_04525 [Candidatus Desantisbacteria bacterium CG_4_10_14_0_8_um_filter_48_22]PJB27927.1 MAG: hypothetical protein CO111_02975 [Candidatus Desantisbacteria bacterium CG_4_9_14_3_um_filter_50_7]